MKTKQILQQSLVPGFALGLFAAGTVQAQFTPGDINEIRSINASRVEAADILGGDYGVSGGSYSSDKNVDLNVSKFGGMGDIGIGEIGGPAPLGNTGIGWQPRLQGNMGYLTTKKTYGGNTPSLQGDELKYKTYAIEFGGGARFWFNDHLSLAPTIMGMYGYTQNVYDRHGTGLNQAQYNAAVAAGLIGWNVNTWTIRPAGELTYIYNWRRVIFTLSSSGTYFHTESFNSSNPNLSVNGNSEIWMNKLDVDVPLGVELFKHELRTGGYFSRSDFYGDLATGANTDHMYEVHGRVVLDYLDQLWKFQWIGLGVSYLWGDNFHGVTYGVDVAFQF